MKYLLTCLAILAFAASPTLTHADSVQLYIDAGPSSSYSSWATGDYTMGSEFTVSAPIEVNALGYLDAEGNGLTSSHQVGLWNVVGEVLLGTVIVTPGSRTETSAQGTANWHLEQLGTTLTLGPGTYRVAGLTNSDSGTLLDDKVGNGVTISNGYIRTNFPGGGFNYPNLSFASNGIRSTVAHITTVPEPASAIVLVGLGALGFVRRRQG